MPQKPEFFKRFTHTHGPHAAATLKTFLSWAPKLANLKNRRVFLHEGKRNTVFPRHIIVNLKCFNQPTVGDHPFISKANSIFHRFKMNVLYLEISITEWKLRYLSTLVNQTKSRLQNILILNIFNK